MKQKVLSKYFIFLIFLLFATAGFGQEKVEKAIVTICKFEKIFDQSVGEDDVWYMNDHWGQRANGT